MVYRSAAIVLTAEYGKDNHHVLQSWLHRLLSSCQQWPEAAAVIAKLSEAIDRKVRTFTESLRTDRDSAARSSLIETCRVIAVPAFTNAAIALFDSIISSHHISADEAVLATWLLTGCHPKTVLFETLKRQTELWMALQGMDIGELFSESQRKLLIRAFVQWKNGRLFKPLDRKLRNAERFEEFRRRLRPSLN